MTGPDSIRGGGARQQPGPILVLVGNLTDQKEQEARRLGADYCFQKPYDVDAVRAAVAKALSVD